MKTLFSKKYAVVFFLFMNFFSVKAQSPEVGREKRLIFHDIRKDKKGKILPWYADDHGTSYDFILNAVWNYWENIPGHWIRGATHKESYPAWRRELPFPPKYLIFRTLEDKGVGGDQFAMMLSSWNLYYDYSGNEDVLKNMIFQADWYLKYGLSDSAAVWPNIPYPCNITEAPVYDGDLILGKGITQPDKAGSFGAELVMLYKKTGNNKYLYAAEKIANTLSRHIREGNYDHSPLPFKVNAETGEVKSTYTSNWVGTLQLFDQLQQLQIGDVAVYKNAGAVILEWMKNYPLKNNRWGPFFEDIPMWSDTEINEGTFAWYMLRHPHLFPNWKKDVRYIQDWAIANLGIDHWNNYGLKVMGEQSVYKMQGQSHTSRHASVELLFAELTGDTANKEEAVRQLNFCTYAVDIDGKCRWMSFDTYELWWTDGYGDFVRHFLRAMDAAPELAPSFQDHILSSTSVIQTVKYKSGIKGSLIEGFKKEELKKANLYYKTFDRSGQEKIRLVKKPSVIFINKKPVFEVKNGLNGGYVWKPLNEGGVLTVNRINGNEVIIMN